MNRCWILSILLLLKAASGWAEDVALPLADDLPGLVLRMEQCFNGKDPVALQSCFHSDAIYVNPPNRNQGPAHEVITGAALRDLLAMTLQHPVTAGSETLVIDGTGAFTSLEYGSSTDMLMTAGVRVCSIDDAPARIGFVEERFVGARCDGGIWRFAFFFPRFVDPRVVVTAVAPGSQAQQVGIQPGDIITHHMMMEMILSQQVLWRWQMFVGDPPDRSMRVLVRRGDQVFSCFFYPGDMGVTTCNCLEGRPGTRTLSGVDAVEHPAGLIVEQYLEGLHNADAAQLTTALCRDGYHFPRGLPGSDGGDPITHASGARNLTRALSQLQEQWDFSSLSFSDIRLIIYADLALGGWHMRVETRNNGPVDRHGVVALVRTNAGWGIVATPWQDDHILGLP